VTLPVREVPARPRYRGSPLRTVVPLELSCNPPGTRCRS
jgi:hypothetical protein